MFKTRKDIDRHVRANLTNLNDSEKKYRGFTIAKLYYKINEFSIAAQYLTDYISVNKEKASAYKLLGNCMLKLNRLDKALESFQTSLQLDSKQPDILTEVCKILLESGTCNLHNAEYWCNLAEVENISNDSVYSLRLKIYENNEINDEIIESQMRAQISKIPNDSDLKIKYVNFLIKTNKLIIALKYALDIELKSYIIPSCSNEWLSVLSILLDKISTENILKNNWNYMLLKTMFLEKKLLKSFSNTSENSNETEDLLYEFDQHLYNVFQNVNGFCNEMKKELFKHFRGQLCLHFASYLLKKDHLKNNFKETTKNTLPLLLCAYQTEPPTLNQPWIATLQSEYKDLLNLWKNEGSFRCFQAGRTILSFALNFFKSNEINSPAPFKHFQNDDFRWINSTSLINKIQVFASDQKWRSYVYQESFSKRVNLIAMQTSFFLGCDELRRPIFHFPSNERLKIYQNESMNFKHNFLPHITYLWLNADVLENMRLNTLENKQFSFNNLECIETDILNILDMETFLYGCVFQAKRSIEVKNENQAQSKDYLYTCLPFANVQSNLCTKAQLEWWYVASKGSKECNSIEIEKTLKYGLEAIRCVKEPRIDLVIIFKIGNILLKRSEKESRFLEKQILETRAHTFFKYGLEFLKKSGKALHQHELFFSYLRSFDKTLTVKKELDILIENVIHYMVGYCIQNLYFDDCVKLLDGLREPIACFYLSQLYKMEPLKLDSKIPRNELCQNDSSNAKPSSLKCEDLCSFKVSNSKNEVEFKDKFLNKNIETLETVDFNTINSNKTNAFEDSKHFVADSFTFFSKIEKNISNFKNEFLTFIKPEINIIRQDICLIKKKLNDMEKDSKSNISEKYAESNEYNKISSENNFLYHFGESQVTQAKTITDNKNKTELNNISSQNSLFKTNSVNNSFELQRQDKIYKKDNIESIHPESICIENNKQSINPFNTSIETMKTLELNPSEQTAKTECVSLEHSLLSLKSTNNCSVQYALLNQSSCIKHPNNITTNQEKNFIPSNMFRSSNACTETPFSNENNYENYENEYDPRPDFKPVIPLPAEIKLSTGEEDEEVLFQNKAKLYRFAEKEWKERGYGVLKILINKKSSVTRILMRRDLTHKICANHKITADMNLISPSIKNDERSFIWAANDYADEEFKIEKFCVRFKQIEVAKEFLCAFEKAKQSTQNKIRNNDENNYNRENDSVVRETSVKVVSLEDFSTPSQILSVTLPNTLNHGGTQNLSINTQIKKIENEKSDNDTIKSEIIPSVFLGKELESTPTYKPALDFSCVKIAEKENENVLYEQKAKFLRYDTNSKKWKEDGIGIIKIFQNQTDNTKIRLVMKCEKTKKLCCNQFLFKNTKFSFSKNSKTNNSLTWTINDNSENVIKNETFSLKFESDELCQNFLLKIEQLQASLYSEDKLTEKENNINTEILTGFGDKFKPKEGSWSCRDCYTLNAADSLTCVACQAPKNLESNLHNLKLVNSTEMKSNNDYKINTFSFGFNNFQFTKSNSNLQFKTDANLKEPIFKIYEEYSKEKEISNWTKILFDNKQASDLEIKNETNKFVEDNEKFIFGKKDFSFHFNNAKSIGITESQVNFQIIPKEDTEESDQDLNEEENNIYFAPIVQLEKVDIKTGEEDEEELYCHRAKLFRFVNKEWKERGLGNVKILRHKLSNKLRIIMRREQVHKICLNHLLTPDVEYKFKDNKSWMFAANDFSDGEIKPMQFCIRFKTNEVAEKFKQEIQQALELYATKKKEEKNIIKDCEEKEDLKYVISNYNCSGCRGCNCDNFAFSNFADNGSLFLAEKPLPLHMNEIKSRKKKSILKESQLIPPIHQKISSLKKNENTNNETLHFIMHNVKETGANYDENNLSNKTKCEFENPKVICSDNITENSNICKGLESEKSVGNKFETATLGSTNKEAQIFGKFSLNLICQDQNKLGKQTKNSEIGQNYNFFKNNMENLLDFASLAKSSNEFSKNTSSETTNSAFYGLIQENSFTNFFKSDKKIDGNDDINKNTKVGESDENINYDPFYKPIIELPKEITVSTGEENEVKLFGERATLFRYDGTNKEWKERGVGEIKVLFHPIQKMYRILLRREQIHKLVLNHLINEDFNISKMNNSEKSFCWAAMNYAEEQPKLEKLAIRFKKVDIANQFNKVISESLTQLKNFNENSK